LLDSQLLDKQFFSFFPVDYESQCKASNGWEL
jgi:hypothetical protein